MDMALFLIIGIIIGLNQNILAFHNTECCKNQENNCCGTDWIHCCHHGKCCLGQKLIPFSPHIHEHHHHHNGWLLVLLSVISLLLLSLLLWCCARRRRSYTEYKPSAPVFAPSLKRRGIFGTSPPQYEDIL